MSNSALNPISNANSTPKRNEQLFKSIIKNWKTTSIGVVLSLTGFVAFSPSNFGGEDALVVQVSKYIQIGGLAAFGVVAKDSNNQ